MIRLSTATSAQLHKVTDRKGANYIRPGACNTCLRSEPELMQVGTNRRNYRRLAAVAACLISLIALSACGEKKAEPAMSGSNVQEVPVTCVLKQMLNRVDQLPGEIQAYQDVAVYPKVPGFIKWIGVDRGSKVKKGQLICGLIAPELIAQRKEANSREKAAKGQLHEAEAKLAAAKATLLDEKARLAGDNDTYERTKQASTIPGVVAPNEVVVLEEKVAADKERVKAWEKNVEAAENAVHSLADALAAAVKATENYKDIEDYLTIAAPFDGYVTERNLHVGSFVGPLGKGAYPPIVRVQQLSPLRIVTPVPEINTGGVLPGSPVEFTVSTYPGERFVGTVARIGNYLDQRTRTMPVELNFWNPGWRVLPGMFCEVYWPMRRHHPSLFLPPSAVNTRSTLATFVCRIRNSEVEWVPVERGEMMGGWTEVFGDLKEGDVVALNCSDALKPHTRVKPVAVKQETADLPEQARPAYQSQGAPLAMPSGEMKEMQQAGNEGKPQPH